jgi:hypothetical protein
MAGLILFSRSGFSSGFDRSRAYKWLTQFDFRCLACGADLREVKWHIDHIYPRARGGSDDPTNLQILCASCNCSKGARTMGEWAPHLLINNRPLISWRSLGWVTPDREYRIKSVFEIGDVVEFYLDFSHMIARCVWISDELVGLRTFDDKLIQMPNDCISSAVSFVKGSRAPQFGQRRQIVTANQRYDRKRMRLSF